MQSILAALIPNLGANGHGTAGKTGVAGDGALFKGTLTQVIAKNAAPASVVIPTANTVSALAKKINALLASGASVNDVVKTLAKSLAEKLAGQFSGDPTQIIAQLQAVFAAALAPPATTGSPPSNADTASALAQRFANVANTVARVSSETGQSNRLFAGSILDAVPTAGEQPAPDSKGTTQSDPPAADALVSSALTALSSLTATPAPIAPVATSLGTTPAPSADDRTVAIDPALAVGTNGNTLLGRTLARASLADTAAQTLAQNATTLKTPVLPTATAVASAVGATAATIDPALKAFVTSFSDALAKSDAAATTDLAKPSASSGDTPLLATTVNSAQAPSVGAFVPVQAPLAISNVNADPSQLAAPIVAPTPVDPNTVVDQVVRGIALQTGIDGTSSVRLKLTPETLGDVSVSLNISAGRVDATVTAQTADARDALLAGQAQLTRSLADSGLKLTSFNVDLAGGFAYQQQQQSQEQPKFSQRRSLVGGVDTAEPDDTALAAVPSFAPSTTHLDFGPYNYLV